MVPKVSVIVPVYNCENYISTCIESILNQTYLEIEIIIVNDGSIDKSEQIIMEYKERDNRIIYLYQENNGPSVARNKGISSSTGEYLVFIDSDDTVDKQYIELLLKETIRLDADLVCCGYKDYSKYGIKNHTDFNINENVSLHTFMEMVCKGTGGVLWGKIFKREVILKNNLKMDKNIFMSEDLVFVLQYVSRCKVIVAIQEYLYNYNRLNQGSISSNISINYIHNNIMVCEYLEEIFHLAKLDEKISKKIIVKRIQDFVLSIVEYQSKNVKKIGNKKVDQNVKEMLSIPYIMKYKSEFRSTSIYYKPFLFFIKNKFYKTCIIYIYYLNLLKTLKRKLTLRKQVSL
ncbi:glycosyltransferase involved in cell wall biosynthesis [Metabacillus crassostreae]|uniref:glycosyltransferase family 2 protein n=1 Tax=Metabacillus crassostreae TaxID=929098 RepID=UPI00195D1A01|nr:glycosyltransferase family 2 protein [Metabacillus crassostreae]MBM7604647.1 glycosyltransferase involved in cell wall biosynthesis [Metabacillus crassostreae]